MEKPPPPKKSTNPQAQKKKKRLSQEEKRQAETNFLLAFQTQNYPYMFDLVQEFPFLKAIRFKEAGAFEDIPKEDHHLCPEGFSPLQIASYKKDLELLDFLLNLDMEFRAKKRPGGESLESNPLHIALKRDFKEGVKRILSHAGFSPFGLKNRFIDEKDHLKKTPWSLAIEKDLQTRTLRYTNLVGFYRPSGYVSSYTSKGPRDGYEIARDTGESALIEQAYRWLKAPNYKKYQRIRQESSRPPLKPVKTSRTHLH